MAKIRLSEGGFQLIPEGTTTFKIVAVEYKEDFGKMRVEMQTKTGAKHTEQFTLLTKSGEVNEGALKAFSYFAKTALNNFSLDEIDETDLIGCYITATVKHESFTFTKGDRKGEEGTAVRLNDYTTASGFGGKVEEDEEDEDDTEDTDDLDDLDNFLGDDE